jgi:hypothetical protein
MNGNVKLCAECGRSAESKLNIELVSGIEIVSHKNKNGKEQVFKKPQKEHSLDICEDCFRKAETRVNNRRPWYILGGLALTVVGLYLAFLEIRGLINESFSLWIDTGLGVEVMPWILVIIAILVPLVPIIAGVVCLQNGFGTTEYLVFNYVSDKLIEKMLGELKEEDKDGRYFVSTKKSFGKDWTIKADPVPLESPCRVALMRSSNVIGSFTNLRVFMNGEEQEKIGNGKTITMQTGLSQNLLTVVDGEDNSKTIEFEAESGGNVNVSLQFAGMVMTVVPA